MTPGDESEPTSAAQVVLRAVGSAPDPAVVRDVQAFFERAGFTVGPFVGTNFSIEGPLHVFTSVFGTERQALEQALGGSAGAAELDHSALPDEVRAATHAVVTTARPDFGPWNP